jgi:hypothetical protein
VSQDANIRQLKGHISDNVKIIGISTDVEEIEPPEIIPELHT